jgi:hypothetical protein
LTELPKWGRSTKSVKKSVGDIDKNAKESQKWRHLRHFGFSLDALLHFFLQKYELSIFRTEILVVKI